MAKKYKINLYMKPTDYKLNDFFGIDIFSDCFEFDELIYIITMDDFLNEKIE
jgi:hypothetical protein